jgi:hypothetical protein
MPFLVATCVLVAGCAAGDDLLEPRTVSAAERSALTGVEADVREIEIGDTISITLALPASRSTMPRRIRRGTPPSARAITTDTTMLRRIDDARFVAIAPGSATISVVNTASVRSTFRYKIGGSSRLLPPVMAPVELPPAVLPALQVRSAVGTPETGEVSSGLPLAPGRLRTGDVAGLAVFVGDTEVPSYIEPLKGRHVDGSLRSILVQFTVADAGAPVTLRRVTTAPRRRPRVAPSPVPARFVMYADLIEEAQTNVVGPISLSSRETFAGGRALDTKFAEFEPTHWSAQGDDWTANFYDRALAYFAYALRQGSPTFLQRGSRLAVAYRRGYLEANNYGTSEWWAQLDGLASHYWLTGDDSSRIAVIRAAESLNVSRGGTARLTNTQSHEWMDGRVTARVLSSKFLAISLDADPYGSVSDWRAAASQDVRDVLSIQGADGTWRYAANCGQSSNFMSGLVAQALIQYGEVTGDVARIREPVRRFASWLWTTQWQPGEQSFNYYSGRCVSSQGQVIGDTYAGTDLNGFFLEMYGWLWKQTNDPVHVQRGDAVMQGMLARTWFAGSKQFNQAFRTSWRYLALR